MNNFEQAKNFIKKHHSFLVASHARTDGDDLGSILAIVQLLKSTRKDAVPLAKGGVPASLKFLPNQHEVLEDVPAGEFDAAILSGCCDVKRTGLQRLTAEAYPILNIDHHPDNAMFGQVNLVDKNKSSVAELVYDLIKYIGANFNAAMAKCLLTGIFIDTGSFMHPNTSAAALQAAGELMKHGARIDKIYKLTQANKNLHTFRAWAKALENTKIEPKNKMAVSVLSEDDIKEVGQIDEDTFTGFTDVLNTIPEARFSMFVRQEGEQIKGSIRSDAYKNVDVGEIARMMGGGGHRLASGFMIRGKILKRGGAWEVLAEANKK